MGSAAPPSDPATAVRNPRKSPGFLQVAKGHKQSFIQLLAVTGIFMLSSRSLGQKYHVRELEGDIADLREEQDQLTERMNRIKTSLLHEASLDSTGLLASRLRRLFGQEVRKKIILGFEYLMQGQPI